MYELPDVVNGGLSHVMLNTLHLPAYNKRCILIFIVNNNVLLLYKN